MPAITDSVQFVKGIGPKKVKLFEKLHISTLQDALETYPRDYEDRTQITRIADIADEDRYAVRAILGTEPKVSRIRKGMTLVKCTIFDESGSLGVTWFNQPYITAQLRVGQEYLFYGRVQGFGRARQMISPQAEKVAENDQNPGRIVPVYPLTAGLTQRDMARVTEAALDAVPGDWPDPLPEVLRVKYRLPDAADALAAIQSGTPYIGYGSNSSTVAKLIGAARSSASGMDCLGFVTYPTTTLVNASYVVDGDDILYGYGLGWFSEIPEGAQVLVQMDGSKTPTEGFIKANTDSGKEKMNAYLDNSVQAIQYQGADTEGNQVNVVLFANSLTNKVHQRDEYAFISNFLFSSVLSSEAYVPTEAASYTLSYSVDGAQAPADAASYEEDDTVTLAAAPEKGGYTFSGWTIGEQTFEAGAQIVLDSSLTAQADENGVITVTAQFSQNPVEPVTPDQPADPAQPGASTGDHSQMTVWISLAVLCGAGTAAAVLCGKKKKA